MMVALGILAIVMAVGVPQLSIFFKGSNMTANTNAIVGGLHLARSAAIKEAGRVTMCKSSNASSGSPTCDNTASWDDGWFIYVEGTETGNVVGFYSSADGNILRINTGVEGSDTTIRVTNAGIENFVSFSSRGLPTASNGNSVSGVFMVCDDRGLTNAAGNVVANGVVLLASGRVGTTKTASRIGGCP